MPKKYYSTASMSNIGGLVAGLIILFTAGVINAATLIYTYDNLYRLTKVDYGNGMAIEYTYDAAGNRLSHRVSHYNTVPASFTPAGNNVTVSPVNGTTLTFSEVLSSGDTTVSAGTTGPPPPGGFRVGNPPAYYDITTTAVYNPPVIVCITYDPQGFNSSDRLRLFHRENNVWLDVTTSNDTANHTICGQVNSLSPFAIFEPDTVPPIITASLSSPANAAGWHNADVTVSFTCLDMESGIASCPAPVTVSTEGTAQVVSGTAIDNAGNSASTSVIINLDKTPPLLTCPLDVEILAMELTGTPSGNIVIQSFLAGAVAADNLDVTVPVTHNAPDFFPMGNTTVTFTARDDADNQGACNAMVTVKNPPPVFDPVAAQMVNEGDTLVLTVSATDPNNDPLVFSAGALPAGAAFDSPSRTFSYTPGHDVSTPSADSFFDVFFSVSDGNSDVTMPVRITVHNINRQPVAHAGPDRNIQTGSLVTLDGSVSSDPDGELITFNWTQTYWPVGSVVHLSDTALPQPTFVPDVAGYYGYDLVVCDPTLCSGPDSVSIYATAPNVPPNANAGPDQNVLTGLPVLLNGGASSDPDNGPSPMSYLWSFMQVPAGSILQDADITGQSLPLASFMPDASGIYQLDLSVSDGADTSHDQTVITATVNVPPTANAGLDQVILLGQNVILDGLGSYDPDERPEPITYQWSFVSVPAGSGLTNAGLANTNASSASFTPDVTGSYVIQIAVSDGQATATDNMVVTAIQPNANSNGASSYFKESGYNAYATFDVKYQAGATTPSGNLTFSSSRYRRKIVSTGIDSLDISGITAVFSGPCTVNGYAGYYFTATVVDNATPGSDADTFSITVTGPNGFNYTASGTIISGDYMVSR